MANVRILCGADPDALTDSVLREYVTALRAGRDRKQLDAALWLTPTKRSQRDVKSQLLRRMNGACWTPGIATFDGFAEWLLRRAGQPATPISSTVQRLLLRRITQQLLDAGELRHFDPVAHTAGFLDVVQSFIAELKRDEVWPEHFLNACGSALETTQRDRELGQVYQHYQDVLQERSWYDMEGRFWHARNELAAGRCDPLPKWSCIAVVGFADFTRTQHEILQHLAERTAELVITLPWDEARPDVFAKPIATWTRFQRTWPNARREQKPGFGDVIRRGLFMNPRHWTPVASQNGLEIVATTGPHSEYAAVARRIKSLIAEGVLPGDIVVGLRSLTTDGITWSQALRDAGVPVWCEVGPPLKEQGLVKFLLAMLQAELHDWAFHRLMTVLDSSYFRPRFFVGQASSLPSTARKTAEAVSIGHRAVRAVSAVLRRLRLSEQRTVILDVVGRTAARGDLLSEERKLATEEPVEPVAQRAIPLLRWYSSHTEPLRHPHTLADWIDVLAQLVDALVSGEWLVVSGHGSESSTTHHSPVTTHPVHDLWDRVQRRLRDAAEAEAQMTAKPARLTTAEFVAEFRDLIAEERIDPEPEHPGCVRLLGFDQIRHVTVPHLFLAGLTEESFPRRRSDDCLFTNAERRRLSEHGIALQSQERHQQDELLFFQSLLSRAGQTLTISYPEIDANGQPVFASPYLSSLRSLFTPDSLRFAREGQLDPIPPAVHALTASDVRLVAMDAALSGRAGWLRTLGETPSTRPVVSNLVAAVEMAAHRFHASGFTSYEGRLTSPIHQRSLAERFGPQRQFSATELESYATCPFRFWLETVLGIAPLEEPDAATDHIRRGHIVHDVLAELLSPMVAGTPPADLAAQFRSLVAQHLDRQPTHGELQRALTRVEQRLLDDWAQAYASQVDAYSVMVRDAWSGEWTAANPELPFGDVPGEPTEAPFPAYPPLTVGPADRRVLVRGRIDRVDIGNVDGRPVYTVIDYKTGRRPKFSIEEVQSGRALQLALYTLAVQRLGIAPADATPFQLGYWCLRETGFRTGLTQRKFSALDAAVWQSLADILEQTIPQLAAGIRGGEFVVENDDLECTSHCRFHTVCRVNQVRNVADALAKHRHQSASTLETPR